MNAGYNAGHAGGNLTLQAGAFERLYGAARHGAAVTPPWDALLTSYFLDTLADPAAAVRTAWDLLAPGGVWINVGPLHWHQPKLGFLRLRRALAVRAGHARHARHRTHGTAHTHGTHSRHTRRMVYAHTAHVLSTCSVPCLLWRSWEELRGLLRLRGFTLREHRVIRRASYLGRPARRARDELLSGVDSWHDAIFFVAQKHG